MDVTWVLLVLSNSIKLNNQFKNFITPTKTLDIYKFIPRITQNKGI